MESGHNHPLFDECDCLWCCCKLIILSQRSEEGGTLDDELLRLSFSYYSVCVIKSFLGQLLSLITLLSSRLSDGINYYSKVIFSITLLTWLDCPGRKIKSNSTTSHHNGSVIKGTIFNIYIKTGISLKLFSSQSKDYVEYDLRWDGRMG
jgi:hypothetical protein